jgi:homoserine O-acetyltransferase
MEPALKRVKNARFYLIPAGPETRGHGTTALAKFWKAQLADLLASAPARATKGAE